MIRYKFLIFNLLFFASSNITFSQVTTTNFFESSPKLIDTNPDYIQSNIIKVLPTIKVSENKLASEVERALAPTEVITRDEIEQSGAKNLQDVLITLPGVQGYSHAGSELIRFQGLDNKYLQILVDGVPIAGELFGTLPLDQFSLGAIEKVEFVRGANSGWYGNSALGGIINLVTKKSDYYQALSFSHDLRYSFTQKYHMNTAIWQNLGPSFGGFGYFLRGQFLWDDGYFENTPVGITTLPVYINPKEINYQINSRIYWRWLEEEEKDQNRYNVVDVYGDFGQKFIENGGSISTEKQLVENQNARAGMTWKLNQLKDTEVNGFATYKRFYEKSKTLSALNNQLRAQEEQVFDDFEIENSFLVNSTVGDWLVGINYLLQTTKANALGEFNRKYRHTFAAFLRYEINLVDDRLLLSAGTRLLYNNFFNFNASPQIGLRFIATDFLTWRLSYGRGFKVPTFKDNYYEWVHPAPADFLLVGNQNLKPQISDSVLSSLHFKWMPLLNADFMAYFHFIRGAISYGNEVAGTGVAGGKPYNGIRRAENLSQLWRAGIDIEISGNSEYFFYKLSYSFLEGKNNNSSSIAELLVPNSIKYTVGVRLADIKTKISLTGQWSARQLINANTGAMSKELNDLNLNIVQPIGSYFSFYAGVRNILNIRNAELKRQEGAEPFVGLRFYAPNLFTM